jgi:hypothetical protein
MKKIIISLILISSTISAQYTDITIVKEVKVKNKGVVVSAHPLASEAGAKILKWEEMPMMLLLPHNMHLPLYIRRQEISAEADFWLVKIMVKNLRSIIVRLRLKSKPRYVRR